MSSTIQTIMENTENVLRLIEEGIITKQDVRRFMGIDYPILKEEKESALDKDSL